MKKKLINECHIEGYLYEHALENKVSGDTSKNPGTPFISGTVSIATDNEMTNIVQVHYTYVTAVTFTGKNNPSFTTLQNIIDGTLKSAMKDGKENASKIRIDSAIGLNEFFTKRNGPEELVSVKRNEGGFIHVADALVEDEKQRNTFKCDMLITNTKRVEANEERNEPEKMIVKGAIFDFRKALMPVEFTVLNPLAMNYFEGLEASNSNPTFTCVWGRQISQTISRTITEESAFGEPSVRTVTSQRKDFVITGANKETYVWDDEEFMTATELQTLIAARETYLASIKQRQDEYEASKAAAATAAPNKGGFNF